MKNKMDIKSLNMEELTAFVVGLGEKKFRGKQLYEWLHVRQAASFDEMTNLSKEFRERLKETCELVSLRQVDVQISAIDCTRK